jgi:hypothetical protein
MSEKIQSGQSGSREQKDQKAADDQRRNEKKREQPKGAEQHETGSSANSQPGSGSG